MQDRGKGEGSDRRAGRAHLCWGLAGVNGKETQSNTCVPVFPRAHVDKHAPGLNPGSTQDAVYLCQGPGRRVRQIQVDSEQCLRQGLQHIKHVRACPGYTRDGANLCRGPCRGVPEMERTCVGALGVTETERPCVGALAGVYLRWSVPVSGAWLGCTRDIATCVGVLGVPEKERTCVGALAGVYP